jgi:hypothetical protein
MRAPALERASHDSRITKAQGILRGAASSKCRPLSMLGLSIALWIAPIDMVLSCLFCKKGVETLHNKHINLHQVLLRQNEIKHFD